jgi:TolB protein
MTVLPHIVRRAVLGILTTCLLLSPTLAVAQIRGEIVGAGTSRMPVAVPPLARRGAQDSPLAAELVAVLRHDLELSGLFQLIDPARRPMGPLPGGSNLEDVNFDGWGALGARGLVAGFYEITEGGINIELRFFDIPGRRLLGGRRLAGGSLEAGRLGHRVADFYIEAVTGIRGPFDSKLAFVSSRASFAREIWSWTFDDKATQLTTHKTVTMAPSWHPNNGSVVFTSFRGGRPALYSRQLDTGVESRLAGRMGLNIGGVWSPDGKVLVLARENDGDTDLHVLDFAGETQTKLTEHWNIDVDPSWSPDGRQLAFCSSRSGAPQVYVMGYPSKATTRLTHRGSYNCSPVWSPDGRWIAYASRVNGQFQLFVIAAAGGEARQITFAGSNEDPTWSPDSRYVAFSSKRGASKKIFMADLWGRWEVQLTYGKGDDTSPSWSHWLD